MKLLFENWRKYVNEVTTGNTSYEREAEDDGWKDFRDDQDRGDHWETFEGGKYFEYWQLGYDNAQEQHEMDIYHDELSRGEYDTDSLGESEEEETSDEQKLLEAFWNNAAHALQLADMTGNSGEGSIGALFRSIMLAVQEYIEDIDSTIALGNDVRQEDSDRLEKKAKKIIAMAKKKLFQYRSGRAGILDWSDDIIEVGDIIWYHGVHQRGHLPPYWTPYNIASEERATELYKWIKEWAGTGV